MKLKILILALTTVLTASFAAGAVYIEPRISFLRPGGTPGIGDIGRETGRELPDAVAGINFGYVFGPRVSAELRFTHLGEFTTFKTSPNFYIFPPDGGAILPALRTYELVQKTNLFSAALPIRVLDRGRFSLRLTPLLQVESSDIVINDVIWIMTANPAQNTLPQRIFYTRRDVTRLHPGAELSARFQLGGHASVTAHYTYSPLDSYDAHLFGAGLLWSF